MAALSQLVLNKDVSNRQKKETIVWLFQVWKGINRKINRESSLFLFRIKILDNPEWCRDCPDHR